MWAVGGDQDPLLRGRCPSRGQQQIPCPYPNPHYNYKEGTQTNKMFFFSSLNNSNSLCLSAIVVIIKKLNSSLSTKLTHRNPILILSTNQAQHLQNRLVFIFYFLVVLHIIKSFAHCNDTF